MNTTEPISYQDKLHQLADHLQAASNLLRELATERVLPLADDQSWYWTDAWQSMEAEADSAQKQGEYVDFNNVNDAVEFLHHAV